jgi:hypothetical protein
MAEAPAPFLDHKRRLGRKALQATSARVKNQKETSDGVAGTQALDTCSTLALDLSSIKLRPELTRAQPRLRPSSTSAQPRFSAHCKLNLVPTLLNPPTSTASKPVLDSASTSAQPQLDLSSASAHTHTHTHTQTHSVPPTVEAFGSTPSNCSNIPP